MIEQHIVHILYTEILQDLPEDIYKKYLIFLPESMQHRYFKYRRWQDKAANLFSKILLIKGLSKFGLEYSCLEQLHYNEYGRPHLPGNIDFNISHSGNFALCIIASGISVGIDIEEIKPVDFADFKDLMTDDQWAIIRNSRNPLKAFFTFWAIKESIIKADGRGLAIPLNDILISDQTAYYEKKWYLKELNFGDNYCASMATNLENTSINLEYIDLTQPV